MSGFSSPPKSSFLQDSKSRLLVFLLIGLIQQGGKGRLFGFVVVLPVG